MTTFYLVRHGDTAWNRDWRYRGRVDLPLDEIGLSQARATADALTNVGLQAVFSSPLKRAFNTAELIAQAAGLSARPLPDLIDIDYGAWQGKTLAEAEEAHPFLYSRWQTAPHLVQFPDGESLDQVRMRTIRAIIGCATLYPDGVVCLVAHQVVNKVLLGVVLGIGNEGFWRITQATCCINVFRYASQEHRFIIDVLNDTHHLRQMKVHG